MGKRQSNLRKLDAAFVQLSPEDRRSLLDLLHRFLNECAGNPEQVPHADQDAIDATAADLLSDLEL